MRYKFVLYSLTAGLALSASVAATRALSDAQPSSPASRSVVAAFARPDRIAFPADKPYTPQIAALGKMLFFDPRLSGAQNMSCATCHNPSFGWETPKARAIGALNAPLDRHAPTVENLAEAPHLFWDGRADSLEEQARGPITHPKEMGATLEEVVERLSAIQGYRRGFDIAFPDEGLTEASILRAIATYERTLRSGWAPFDAWVEGDAEAISHSAKRGFELFIGRADCGRCHSGWAFTDHKFHDIGLATSDLGRSAVDSDLEGVRAFKTPGLRNIALRAPYMHDGGLGSLRAVLEHYSRGGETPSSIAPLALSVTETADLLAFLETLTADNPHVTAPALPAE